MLVMTLCPIWFMLSKRSSRYLILKIDQSQNDFGQRQELIPTSVIDSH